MAQSPAVEQIRIRNVAGTYALIDWDDIGGIFTYEVQKSANGGTFIPAGFTRNPEYFDQAVVQSTRYVYRVRAVSTEYSPSDWSYTDEFRTFSTNSYAVAAQRSMTVYPKFIDEKFTRAQDHVNFNRDTINAVLIREGYSSDPSHTHIDDVSKFILMEDETLRIYGDVSKACGNRDLLMPVVFNGYLFMFERFQSVVKYSENMSQTWKAHSGISGRVGAPIGSQVAVASSSILYIIGYDGIYTLNFNADVRWSNTDIGFGSLDDTFSGGAPGTFRFSKLIDLPQGVGFGQVEAIAISDDETTLYVACSGVIHTLNLVTLNTDSQGNRSWDANPYTFHQNDNVRVKNLIGFDGDVYAYIVGEIDLTGDIHKTVNSGVWKINMVDRTSTHVYGNQPHDNALLDLDKSNLSRSDTYLCIDTMVDSYNVVASDDDEPATPGYDTNDLDPERVDYSTRYEIDLDKGVTAIRYHRKPVRSFNGTDWFVREETYHFESQYLWFNGDRIWVNFNHKLCVINKAKSFIHTLTNTSETLNKGTFVLNADSFAIDDYPGYTIGAVLYRVDTGDLVGFYNLGYRTRDRAVFAWIPDRVVMTATLASNSIDIVEPEPLPDSETDIVPPLDPLVYQLMPETFIHNEPLYVEFVEEYLKFMSSDVNSDYGQLYSLLRNHDVNETAYLQMFMNDLSKRNVYLDDDKWTELMKFSNNRGFDIYSIKGIRESYKFLFKFLYNEDVVVTTEADAKYEFDIIIDSDNLTSDLVGNRIQTPDQNGQADVVYYERYFDSDGVAYWRITLNNIVGEFVAGDEVTSVVDPNFAGVVYRGVSGKEKPLNNEDYLYRGPSYYAISVQSAMQVSKYRDDVIRFIHPVGFGFVGIMLITMFINSGISTTHKETIIDLLQTLKWDMGLPRYYPDQVPVLNPDGSYKTDKYGNIQYNVHPNAGEEFPLRPTYLIDNPEIILGQDADQRRKQSFLWDSSNMRFIETRKIVNGRLKDGINQRKDS